jgi:hypothetical protein
MGFISFKTCDTNRSIANSYSSRKTFKVHLITPDGRVFTEKDYQGYCQFGGKNYYDLLAELNGVDSHGCICINDYESKLRDIPNIVYPKLVEFLYKDVVGQYKCLPNPKRCKYQGYFYNEDFK